MQTFILIFHQYYMEIFFLKRFEMFLFNFIAVAYFWVYLPTFSAFFCFDFKKEESRGKAKKLYIV